MGEELVPAEPVVRGHKFTGPDGEVWVVTTWTLTQSVNGKVLTFEAITLEQFRRQYSTREF